MFQLAVEDEDLTREADARASTSKAQLDNFVIAKKAVPMPTSSFKIEDSTVTMAQFFRDSATVIKSNLAEEVEDSSSDSGEPPSTVFLEDLETYKNYLWVYLSFIHHG